MQSQEESHSPQEREQAQVYNTDPREQVSPYEPSNYNYEEHTYAEGYTEQQAQYDRPAPGEKLRPQAKGAQSQSPKYILPFIVIICLTLAFTHTLSSVFTVTIISLLLLAAAFVIIRNWQTIIIPQPTQTFSIQEHAQLNIENSSGKVTIRKGEQNFVTITPTKRAYGLWITPDNMRINYNQRGDSIEIVSKIQWFALPLGFKAIDLEITVPQTSDIQMKNGVGQIDIQEVTGNIRLQTGSGKVEAHRLAGEIVLKTGSGQIDVSQMQGKIDINTGSGTVSANQLNGEVELKTGSGTINVERIQGRMNLRTGSGAIRGENMDGELALKTGSGTIALSAVTGKAALITGSGTIRMEQALLKGDSSCKTGSGSIYFSGALDPFGRSNFRTGSGTIDLTLAERTAFSLKASTGSGGISNEFGNNEVGEGPRTQITARTGSGRIRIQRGI